MATKSESLTQEEIIDLLHLSPHPEGGYFKETYRDTDQTGDRAQSTAIYFLLQAGNYSRLHRIDAAEGWHFYAGDPLEVIELAEDGAKITRLGIDLASGARPQHVVPKERWFGARVAEGGRWSLVGCTVASGFEYATFELGEREHLFAKFPACKDVIVALTPAEH